MKILAVDTALGACSVALLDEGQVLAHRHVLMERGHAEALAPMVDEAMTLAGVTFAALDRLAVTTGPGTFTGQRVGLAFMRGLRIALHRPLIGVTTLAAMAAQAKAETGAARAIALHDARRDEVYLEIENLLAPCVLSFPDVVERLRDIPTDGAIALAGTAAPRVCDAVANRFLLSSVRQPDALWVARLALTAESREAPPRPLYLRAPDAKFGRPAMRSEIAFVGKDADLSPLARLHAACFPKAWSAQALGELLQAPGTTAFAAPDGFVMTRVAGDEAEVLTIAVAPDARRRGLGMALLEHAASHSRDMGAMTMVLEVGTSNAAALALYRRFGFEAVGARKAYYAAEGGDAHILRADLARMPLGKPLASIRVGAQTRGKACDAD